MLLLKISQIIVAVLLMAAILLQNKGSAVSGLFGGNGNVYMTKRGFDKFLVIATIVLAIAFFSLSFLAIVI
jgi:protein translocase SecG subunit